MCTKNNDIETLKKLRAKGHVLIPVYKYRDERYYNYDFKNGWNMAVYSESRQIMTRTNPYPKRYNVYSSFHFYLHEQYSKRFHPRKKQIKRHHFRKQQTFWIYADEITACQKRYAESTDTTVVTCSRAFIKQLNKKFAA
jgi:hypothetical protein